MRMLAPSLLFIFLGFSLAGVATNLPELQFRPKLPPIGSVAVYAADDGALSRAGKTIWKFAENLLGMPQACRGQPLNDMQVSQCTEFWDMMLTYGVTSLIPLGLWVVFILLSMDSLIVRWRRTHKKIQSEAPKAIGKVTQPAEASMDLYSWVFCFRPIGVQLSDGRQICVCQPLDAPIPLPGQKFAIYEMGYKLGARRYHGLVYAPHLAVVKGVR